MSVNHRGTDVCVSEEFLGRPDVLAGLKQVGRKAMSERVRGNMNGNFRLGHGPLHCALHPDLMQVMPAKGTAASVHGVIMACKNKLPFPSV